MSIKAAASKHSIPEATIQHKLSGRRPMSSTPGPKPLLTEAEEQVLVNYIINAWKRAHPVTKSNVMKAVKGILEDEESGVKQKRPPSVAGTTPKEKWWTLFKNCHPEITYRTPQTLTSSRKNISMQVIKQWFNSAHDFLVEINALDILEDPSWQFNIDETGFSLSPKQGKVLGEKGAKNVFEESSVHHKANITVLGNVCADGSVPPPLITYPRKRINFNTADKFPSGYDFTVGKSEKGYITFETLYEYLCNDFHDWLTEKKRAKTCYSMDRLA